MNVSKVNNKPSVLYHMLMVYQNFIKFIPTHSLWIWVSPTPFSSRLGPAGGGAGPGKDR